MHPHPKKTFFPFRLRKWSLKTSLCKKLNITRYLRQLIVIQTSMDDQTKVNKPSATVLLLLWSIWWLQLVAQSLWSDIPNHFYEQAGVLLGYKVLLNLCLLFLTATVSLFILYFSKHTNQKEYSTQKLEPTNDLLPYYGMLWDKEANPYCPSCKNLLSNYA